MEGREIPVSPIACIPQDSPEHHGRQQCQEGARAKGYSRADFFPEQSHQKAGGQGADANREVVQSVGCSPQIWLDQVGHESPLASLGQPVSP